jgi:hypothetical protein
MIDQGMLVGWRMEDESQNFAGTSLEYVKTRKHRPSGSSGPSKKLWCSASHFKKIIPVAQSGGQANAP